mmetsp:Transcript_59086/g.139105  ORF Transcript_59086/g.139105 Transcript_59086/m.139105 type:complete len:263 (-) Transcript_59086:2947-3735(-)
MVMEAVPAEASVKVIDSTLASSSDDSMATSAIVTPRVAVVTMSDASSTTPNRSIETTIGRTSLVWPTAGAAKLKTATEVSTQTKEESTVTLAYVAERMVKALEPAVDSDGTVKDRMLLVKEVRTSVMDASFSLVRVTPAAANSTSMSATLASLRMFSSVTTINADSPSQSTGVLGASSETTGAPVGTATYSIVLDTDFWVATAVHVTTGVPTDPCVDMKVMVAVPSPSAVTESIVASSDPTVTVTSEVLVTPGNWSTVRVMS